jgi:hypothetical protein
MEAEDLLGDAAISVGLLCIRGPVAAVLEPLGPGCPRVRYGALVQALRLRLAGGWGCLIAGVSTALRGCGGGLEDEAVGDDKHGRKGAQGEWS